MHIRFLDERTEFTHEVELKRTKGGEEGAFHTVYIPHTGSHTESCDVFTHHGEYEGDNGKDGEQKAGLCFILGSEPRMAKERGAKPTERGHR